MRDSWLTSGQRESTCAQWQATHPTSRADMRAGAIGNGDLPQWWRGLADAALPDE